MMLPPCSNPDSLAPAGTGRQNVGGMRPWSPDTAFADHPAVDPSVRMWELPVPGRGVAGEAGRRPVQDCTADAAQSTAPPAAPPAWPAPPGFPTSAIDPTQAQKCALVPAMAPASPLAPLAGRRHRGDGCSVLHNQTSMCPTNTGSTAERPAHCDADQPIGTPASPTQPVQLACKRSVDRRGFDHRNAGHGMLTAGRVASRWAVAWRHIKMRVISKLPGCRFKSRLIKWLLGVKLGEDVGLAYDTFLDPYDPTLISIGNNVLIGYGTKIFVHAFTLTRQRVRPVTIGNNVMIGGFCVIAPGVTIGDGASIAPGTIVGRDVPPGAMAMGNTMHIRKRGAA